MRNATILFALATAVSSTGLTSCVEATADAPLPALEPDPGEPNTEAGLPSSETDTTATDTTPTDTTPTDTAPTDWAEVERRGVPRYYPMAYRILDFGWDARFIIGGHCLRAKNDPRGVESPDPEACVEQPDGSGVVESWTAHVLRPEVLNTGERGFANVSFIDNPSFFSNDGDYEPLVLIEAAPIRPGNGSEGYDPPSGIIDKVAAVSIAVDPNYTVNPYRSDGDGNPSASGNYETYKALVYHTVELHEDDEGGLPEGLDPGIFPGVVRLTLTVSEPRTANASVHSARLEGVAEPLYDTNGDRIRGSEITATGDGRLVMFHGDVSNRSDTNGSINYTFNAAPGVGNGWSVPKNVARMYFEDRDVDVAGLPFHERYPLASEPLHDYDGVLFDADRGFTGAYPWLTRDGTAFSCSMGRHAASIIGSFTGYHLRHMDGPMNPSREGRYAGLPARTQIHSPGMTSTMWHPYLDLAEPPVPALPKQYVMPLVGGGADQYAEVSFDEFMDGDYIVWLGMNEGLRFTDLGSDADPTTSFSYGFDFDPDRTFDTSGRLTVTGGTRRRIANLHHGQLTGGASFPLEAGYADEEVLARQEEWGVAIWDPNNFPPEDRELPPDAPSEFEFLADENYDRMIGMHGQGILMPGSGAVLVPHTDTLGQLTDQMTVELFLKILQPEIPPMGLVKKGSFGLSVKPDGTVTFSVETNNGRHLVASTATLPTKRWVHVAGVFDGIGEDASLSVFFDGTRLGFTSLTGSGPLTADTDDLVVGPHGSASGDDWLLIVDEFALSRVARSASELQANAYIAPEHPLVSVAKAGRDAFSSLVPTGLPLSRVFLPKDPGYPDGTFWQVRELGERIFADTGISRDGERSCAGCHQADLAFTDGRAHAEGLNGKELSLNTPTILNRAMGTRQFLDGRAASVEEQVVMPIIHPDEMGMAMPDVLSRLQTADYYNAEEDGRVGNHFETIWGEPASEQHLKTALGLYVRTLFGGGSRVDAYEAGDLTALTDSEVRGRALFLGRGRCVSCHHGPNYTDEQFHATALTESEELGRNEVTGRMRHRFAIKTPTLRDIDKTAPYFHDGSAADLERVVELYNDGPIPGRESSVRVFPLDLTEEEQADLVAFLKALGSSGP